MTQQQPHGRGIGGTHSAQKTSGGVSASAFAKHLKDIKLPTNKAGIVEHLKKMNASKEILDIAQQFHEEEFHTVADVEKQFGKVKRHET